MIQGQIELLKNHGPNVTSKQRIANVLPKYTLNLDMNQIFANDEDQQAYEKVSSSSGLMQIGPNKPISILTSPFSAENHPSFVMTPRQNSNTGNP